MEAVVLLPILVMLLAASLHVGQLHGQQQRLLQQARLAGWEHALGGCQGSPPSVQTSADGDSGAWLSARGVSLPEQTAGHVAEAGGPDATGSLGSARIEARARIGSEPLLGIDASELSVAMRLPCNERPRATSLEAALRLGWQQVRVW